MYITLNCYTYEYLDTLVKNSYKLLIFDTDIYTHLPFLSTSCIQFWWGGSKKKIDISWVSEKKS